MSAGHIRSRGKGSWELKFDAGRDPATGKRKIQYVSFRGTKREAQVKLASLIAAVGNGGYVEPSKLSVAEHVRASALTIGDRPEAISARTAQRYHQLSDGQIAPHIGARLLQKLTTLDIERWQRLTDAGRHRGQGGVAPRTVVHAHRVLSHALDDAVRHGVVPRNIAKLQPPPRVTPAKWKSSTGRDLQLLTDLRGHAMYAPAIVALFTGMRLGEILAMRWRRVDLDRKVIFVREALEETKAHGIRMKAPKSRAGRRDIGLPEIVVDALARATAATARAPHGARPREDAR